MSVIGCILIALIAQRWKSVLIAALVIGILGSTAYGFLHWADTHYGSAPNIGFMGFYVVMGTAAFTAETAAFFAIKLGFNALRARRRAKKTPQPTGGIAVHLLQKPKVPNINVIIASVTGVIVLLAFALAISLQPFRDHLRKRYGFEQPEYYDTLPADTDANRVAVIKLLAERDRDEAALQEALKPKPQTESRHGRKDSFGGFIITDPPQEPPRSLADGYEIERSLCHVQWGLLDRTLNLCQSVDRSADAAEHYARDVESYWIPRLRPTPLIVPEPLIIPSK